MPTLFLSGKEFIDMFLNLGGIVEEYPYNSLN